MTGSNKVKIVADGEPEEKKMMTSLLSSGRPLSWLHLCVIYGLLGMYGLWAATSYQLIRSSVLDELEASMQRKSQAIGELGVGGIDHGLETDMAAERRRRSVDDSAAQSPAELTDSDDIPSPSRRTRESRRRGTNGRRRRNRGRIQSDDPRRSSRGSEYASDITLDPKQSMPVHCATHNET